MKKASLVGFAVLLIFACHSLGDAEWCDDIEINPKNPTSSDVVSITLSGWWPDSCVPNGSGISVVGTDIYFDVLWDYPPDVICATVITEWDQTQFLNPRRGDILDLMDCLTNFHEFEKIVNVERGQK